MKKKYMNHIVFLTCLLGSQIYADPILSFLEIMQAVKNNAGSSHSSTAPSVPTIPVTVVNAPIAKSTLTRPVPKSQQINLQPTVDPKTLPGVTEFFVIPSTVAEIQVQAATNVGDLYTSFSFNASNIALINAALAKGNSLQFAINIQQNNANYNVTGTIYDLQNNVIATEVRQNVVNRALSGVTNTANIAVGSPISAPVVFSYYDITVTLTGQNVPLVKKGMTLSSTAIFAAPSQSVAINSPIQQIEIMSNSSIPSLSVNVSVSAQNMLDMNRILANDIALTLFVSMVANAQENYDFIFVAYDAAGNIVAQEVRSSVVNSSAATNSANIALNQVIPVAAATFSSVNITCRLMNSQEELKIKNLPFTNTIALAPTIPASSIIVLPVGITSLTDINFMPQFGSTAAPGVVFDLVNFIAINTALAAGDAVSVLCDVNDYMMRIGAYDFMTNNIIAIQDYGFPAGTTAATFSGYGFQYLVAGQPVGTVMPANQKIQCTIDQTITFMPSISPINVNSSIIPSKTGGSTTFVADAASLKAFNATTLQAYNEMTPVSVVGGRSALQLISVHCTDANKTATLKFDFTPAAGLQNITQELLNNGLYICFNIIENVPTKGLYSIEVTLEDAQGNVYATGSAPITTQMVYGWVGFNMEQSTTPATATTTSVQAIPLAMQQAVLYRQQTVTSPAQ